MLKNTLTGLPSWGQLIESQKEQGRGPVCGTYGTRAATYARGTALCRRSFTSLGRSKNEKKEVSHKLSQKEGSRLACQKFRSSSDTPIQLLTRKKQGRRSSSSLYRKSPIQIHHDKFKNHIPSTIVKDRYHTKMKRRNSTAAGWLVYSEKVEKIKPRHCTSVTFGELTETPRSGHASVKKKTGRYERGQTSVVLSRETPAFG